MKKSKRILILGIVLALALVPTLLVGCSSTEDTGDTESTETASNSETSTETDWPTKSIEIVVPFSAGGDTDFNARTLAKYLTDELGQSVAVVNITGGGSSIAMDEVKSGPADGYRFLVNHAPMHLTEAFGVIDYGWDEFNPVSIFGMGTGEFLTVRSDFPADTVEELIEETKKNPGKYRFGYSAGATSHYAGVSLQRAGADLNMVPSGNASDRVVGLKGDHLDIIVSAMPTIKDYVETGEFKVIASCSSEKYETYPDIPTVKEQGYDLAYEPSYTLYAVKGTDPAIIEKLSEAIKTVTTNEAYAEDIKKAYNQVPYYKNTEETIDILTEQNDRYMGISDELRSSME